jgi:hypothetical protein
MTLHQLPDASPSAGFFDPRGARVVLRRMKLRRALLGARRSIDALLNFVEHGQDADCSKASACRDQLLGLLAGDFDGREGREPVNVVDSKDVREKELLEGVEVVLQFLDLLGIGLRHGLFSINACEEDASPRDPRQPLCGDAK